MRIPQTDLLHNGHEHDIIPLLQESQEAEGYISPQTVNRISRITRHSESEIFGVASFYSQFRFTPPGRHSIRVCLGTACHVQGGYVLTDAAGRELGIAPGETTRDGRFDLRRVACLGCCALAPVVQVDETIYSRMSVIRLREILGEYE